MVPSNRSIVLVVEDELLVRIAAVEALIDEGFEVVEAEHAAAAIALVTEEFVVHLLFTDVNMPGDMTGIDLAEHFFAKRPGLKIIITSALPLIRQISHLEAQFLAKPYQLNELCIAARMALAA